MNKPKNTYHHGDLRQGLLDAGTQLIRKEGIDNLSMRKLADALGVSRSAAYHHFRDKTALLSAVAEEGFKAQDQILGKLPMSDNRKRFEQFVRSYIHFATDNPEQYDLMYGREIWKSGGASETLEQAAKRSFKNWLDEVEKLQNDGFMPNKIPTLRVAQATWATLHGLCRLLNDGVYMNRDDIEDMGQTAVELLLR